MNRRSPVDPRTGAVALKLHGDQEILLVPQLFNTAIRIGPAGELVWFDQW